MPSRRSPLPPERRRDGGASGSRSAPSALTPVPDFDPHAFLESAGVARRLLRFRRGAAIYTQGDPAESVMYLHDGAVTLSVLASSGKEAVVGLMGPGDFFGEGCLAGQPVRMGTAKATLPTTVLAIARHEMQAVLHEQHALSDLFIAYVLSRNVRIEADLIDQLFNSSEKRLARTLLLLARFGKPEAEHRVLPKLSQETLAEMIGTTRSRVNVFMNKFRKLGFIEYNGQLRVNPSLLSVVLHD